MGTEWLQSLLLWVQAHPVIASFAVFAAAVAESIFLFGLLVPGALLMFIAGALIGAGALPLLPTFAIAIAGAIAGDSASFALGYAYRGNLNRLPLFQRAPRLMRRGETFLRRHGGKSILLGRFVGPLRPVIPTLTGAASMSPWRFLGIDVVAALGWAPCYILPGVVFGASLDLAAQVAGRLALLSLLVLATVWVLLWALRWLLAGGAAWGREHAERLLAWSRRHRRLRVLGPALADPRQPETPALAVAALILLVLTWLAYASIWGFALGDSVQRYPLRLDALVYHLLEGLHTPWSDWVAQVVASLGAPSVYLPLAAVIAVGMWLLSGRRAAMHWLAAVAFACVLVLALNLLLVIPTPLAYYQGAAPRSGIAGGHILISAVIYGFFAVILASRRGPRQRQLYYSGFSGLIVLIALARLYLGLDWLTDLIIGIGVAMLWVALLTLGYRRNRPRPLKHRPLLAMLIVIIAGAALWQASYHPRTAFAQAGNPLQPWPVNPVNQWPTSGYMRLPGHIIDLVGREDEPLNLQASGELDTLRRELVSIGWQMPIAASFTGSLLWLTTATPIEQLPVLPRMHDGRSPDLTLTKAIDEPAGANNSQWILRLWRSHYMNQATGEPLWLGQIARQNLQRRLELIRMPADGRYYDSALLALRNSLPAGSVKLRDLRVRAGEWPYQLLLWQPTNPRKAGSDGRISADLPTSSNPARP